MVTNLFSYGWSWGGGVFLLGPQCPSKPEDSGETWTSRDLAAGAPGVSFPETGTVVIF